MRKDVCVFILTHGRPNNVITYESVRNHGYTGKIFIVIDDEDKTGELYKHNFGDDVLVFSKEEIAKYTDQFDNFPERRSPLWARNACWDLAKQNGYRYFIQLDDDYSGWQYRRVGKGHRLSTSMDEEYHSWVIKNLDTVFEALVRLIETTSVKTIALSQGGDHVGGALGGARQIRFKRKAMNSFVCDTEKPFFFRGTLNDDVNTYVALGRTGHLFFTDNQLMLNQAPTQAQEGGITELYLDFGTYVKSFYTVLTAPSCVTIRSMGQVHRRLHHHINWKSAIPQIIAEEFQKPMIEMTK